MLNEIRNSLNAMSSEKMRYILCRRKETPRTDIEMTPLKESIEAIFCEQNLDNDCDTIARHMCSYLEYIMDFLKDGDYDSAVYMFLELMESLAYHFVEDEHYGYFDDLYSPDYVSERMMTEFIKQIKAGNLPEENLIQLRDGMQKLMETEAYKGYYVPAAVSMWEQFENGRPLSSLWLV